MDSSAELRAQALTALRAWPPSIRLNWRGWLRNFSEQERPFALCILDNFLYFNHEMTDALLTAAFERLGWVVCASSGDAAARRAQWAAFIDRVILTAVEGESPSPTDSGHAIARRARKLLGLPEGRFLPPRDALAALRADSATPILFVDDFVGSGQQFLKTFRRLYSPDSPRSFAEAVHGGASAPLYAPLIATAFGLRNLRCSVNASIAPVHVLSDQYNLSRFNNEDWPPGATASDVDDFLRATTVRAGHPEGERFGFANLGLAVAIFDTIPDACLPILHSERNGWVPLMRRT